MPRTVDDYREQTGHDLFLQYTATQGDCLRLIHVLRLRRIDEMLSVLFAYFPELRTERQEDLASLLGQSRESISRGFSRLRKKGEI